MTLTALLFVIILWVAILLLTFSLLLPAPERCFRTWVLITSIFFKFTFFLHSTAPIKVLSPSISKKFVGMTLFSIPQPTVSMQKNTLLFPQLQGSTSLTLNAAKSSILYRRIRCQPQTWWCSEMEETMRKRRKAFTSNYRSEEEQQPCISFSRHSASIIAKAQHETCSFFSHISGYSIFQSVASSASSSSFPNFSNCSSPSELALVYAKYLRFYFSESQPQPKGFA